MRLLDKMNDITKPLGIRRNISFIIARIKLAFKENIEYKVNLYSAIAINLVMILVALLFFSVYIKFSGVVLNWSYTDFILYSFIVLAGSKAHYLFAIRSFKTQLLKGHLNNGLIRPVNPYIFHSMFYLMGPVLIIFPFLLFIIYSMLIYYSYTNVFFFTIFFIFAFFYCSFFYSFFGSLAFFIKENDFLVSTANSLNNVVEVYTPKMFQSVSTTYIYIFPSAIFGFLSIELLKGNATLLLKLLPYIIATFFIMIISIYFIWKIGLKRYEAFG